MFDINSTEFLILIVVAALVIGPDKIPGYARKARDVAANAQTRMREAGDAVRAEIGSDVDLSELNAVAADVRGTLRGAAPARRPARPVVSSTPSFDPDAT